MRTILREEYHFQREMKFRKREDDTNKAEYKISSFKLNPRGLLII